MEGAPGQGLLVQNGIIKIVENDPVGEKRRLAA